MRLSYVLGCWFFLQRQGASALYEPQQPLLDTPDAPGRPPAWRDSLISLHRRLIEIPSVSGAEGQVGEFLTQYLTQRGYIVPIQPVPSRNDTPADEGHFNVLAWKGDAASLEARVVVTSHIDVVPPHIPYGISDGPISRHTTIKGRGSVDAKASVAAQIQALENLIGSGQVSGEDVALLFVVGEEDLGDGMKTFSESLDNLDPRPRLDAVIFGEPTENKLACGHKGGLFCDIAAKGVAGHSGYPWLGKSANELMVRALAKVLETDLGSDEVFGNTTVNIGLFDGGVAANVIPDYAYVKLAFRVAIGPEERGGEIVQDQIQSILDGIDGEAFTFQCSHGYGVVEADCNVDGFETAVMNYGTDMPNLRGNHTRYLYGPGSILVAHGHDEHLTVEDLEVAVAGFEKLILHALEKTS